MPTEKLQYVLTLEGDKVFAQKMKAARKEIEGGNTGILSSFSALKAGGIAFLAMLGAEYAQKIGQMVKEGIKLAEENRVIGASFERLAKTVSQNSDVLLAAMKRGMRGTVSELDMMRQANQAILLGLPVTAKQMEELSNVALKLGRAVGRGPTEALGDLITGLGRQSTMILDNLGLTLRAEEAYEKYAKSLGTTAEKLSDAQKRQAFFNAAMDSAREKARQLGEVSGGLNEKWGALVATIKDRLAVALEKTLVPALDAVLSRLNQMTGVGFEGFVTEAEQRILMTAAAQGPEAYAAALKTFREDRTSLQEYQASLAGGPVPVLSQEQAAVQITQAQRTSALAGLRLPRSTGNAGPRDMLQPLMQEQRWNAAAGVFEWKDKVFKDFADSAQEVSAKTAERFREIPEKMQNGFKDALQGIEAGMMALGMRGQGIFGAISGVRYGVGGIGKMKAEGGVTGAMGALQMAGYVGQIVGGITQGFGALKSLFGGSGFDLSKAMAGGYGLTTAEAASYKSNKEIEAQREVVAQTEYWANRGAIPQYILEEERKKLETMIGKASGTSGGSTAYSAVSTVTETTANQLVAVTETMRAQDATRNVILERMDGKLGNIEAATSMQAGMALLRFQGV